jgi:hypothetical protein
MAPSVKPAPVVIEISLSAYGAQRAVCSWCRLKLRGQRAFGGRAKGLYCSVECLQNAVQDPQLGTREYGLEHSVERARGA